MKRILKLTAIGIVVLVIVGGLGMVTWATLGARPAQDVALAAMESSENVTVRQDDWIVFEPASKPDTGIIFYPGGLVEPEAYAPILHSIAEEGVLVVITPMPLNLAILKTGAAGPVIEAYPEISEWIIAGHSLGGAAAAIYAENHPSDIDAVVFWDSFPPESADLSDNDIPVLSIYGTMDGSPNPDNFDDKRHLLPEDATFVAIEGANHAQFGDYGTQAGDVTAEISLREQHRIVTGIMLDFIKTLNRPAA